MDGREVVNPQGAAKAPTGPARGQAGASPRFELHEAIRRLAVYTSDLYTKGNCPRQYKYTYGDLLIQACADMYHCAKMSLMEYNRPMSNPDAPPQAVATHRSDCRRKAKQWALKCEERFVFIKSTWELLSDAPGMRKRCLVAWKMEGDIGRLLGGWLKSLG